MDANAIIEDTFTVGEEHAGLRLDVLLSLALRDYSRTFLQRAIREGRVVVGDRPVNKPSTVVRAGQRIRVALPVLAPDRIEPEAIPLDILYEDEDILVINKPPDMVVHPSRGQASGTLANALLHHCKTRVSDIGGPLRPGIVHRLDRDTSGAILCAKTNAAHRALADQFRMRLVEKEYLAVVRGQPEHDEGDIALPIGRDRRMREKMRVLTAGGRPAMTYYALLERFRRFALVRAVPRTGRTHQIRVHLSFMGHPVAADALYGGGDAVYPSEAAGRPADAREPPLITRQALHAHRLAFTHPVTGRRVAVEAPVPPDMERLLAALRAARGEVAERGGFQI